MDVTVNTHGPLFDGRAPREVQELLNECKRSVAEEAEDSVHRELHSHLKHPTGSYESHIAVTREAGNYVVNDKGVIYGPWLEGISSRNARTRFKGYSAMRRSTARINSRVPEIVRPVVARFVGRLS